MRRIHWYHVTCVPESGALTSGNPQHELCAGCGQEGNCFEAEISTNPDVRKTENWTAKPVEVREAISDTYPGTDIPDLILPKEEEAESIPEDVPDAEIEDAVETVLEAETVEELIDKAVEEIPQKTVDEVIEEIEEEAVSEPSAKEKEIAALQAQIEALEAKE